MPERAASRPTPRHGALVPPLALVVDDEAAVRTVLARWLKRAGWEVALAADGDEAVDLLQDGARYSALGLIICDLRMPRRSGPELYEWIQQHRPELCRHLVFSSGDACDPSIAAFLSACGCPVLEKPFPIDELARAVAIAAPSRAA